MSISTLIIPGYGDSGPQHWQSLWQKKHPEYRRVVQSDWEFPQSAEWLATLNAVVNDTVGSLVLVAHSLGCILVAHWAALGGPDVERVQGALLVAPPDVEQPGMSLVIEGFSPVPLTSLPFVSIVVASSNDEFISLQQAEVLAQAWSSRFINIGPSGHINSEAGYGDWPFGEELLADLLERNIQ